MTAVAPRLPTWVQVNAPGFGEHAGPYTGQEGFDLTVFEDRLYLGMEGYSCARIWRSRAGVSRQGKPTGSRWFQTGSMGGRRIARRHPRPRITITSTASSPSAVTCTPRPPCKQAAKRGSQVWRSATGDAGTWVQVNVPGFGTHTNENFKDMIEYDGLLCGGTMNKGSAQIPPGAQVWCTDGIAPDPTHPGRLRWVQRNLDGFGDPGNVIIWSSAVYGGSLYFGVEALQEEKLQRDGSVWRAGNIRDPNAWAQVFSPADVGMHASRVELLDQLDDYLYVGMVTPDGDAVILRSRSGDRYTWEDDRNRRIGDVPIGPVHLRFGHGPRRRAVCRPVRQVHGTGIWRTSDGTTWMRAAARGFRRSGQYARRTDCFRRRRVCVDEQLRRRPGRLARACRAVGRTEKII